MSKAGANNPNWKGGLVPKLCAVCNTAYKVKRANSSSRYCSLQCVGVAQRGEVKPKKPKVEKRCEICSAPFHVFPSHQSRYHCCSRECSHQRRSRITAGDSNPNWSGGLSRLPYPWNFRDISRAIIERDGAVCRNPECPGDDTRMTAHHINYDKQDCRPNNLICLCSACNSRANFGREKWQLFYSNLLAAA